MEAAVFSAHTGHRAASTACQCDVSSLRDVYFCCIVCGSQKISFIPEQRSAGGSPAEVPVKTLVCKQLRVCWRVNTHTHTHTHTHTDLK